MKPQIENKKNCRKKCGTFYAKAAYLPDMEPSVTFLNKSQERGNLKIALGDDKQICLLSQLHHHGKLVLVSL